MTETRTAQQIAADFYAAEYGIDAQAAAIMVVDLDATELASIAAAVAAEPHLAPIA